jgi:hypothetical protein
MNEWMDGRSLKNMNYFLAAFSFYSVKEQGGGHTKSIQSYPLLICNSEPLKIGMRNLV